EEKNSEVLIILDSDNEDESMAAYKQLTPAKNKQLPSEKNKQLIPSEQAGTLPARVASQGIADVNETMRDGDQNSHIVPYGQSATLMNQYHLPRYQPSVQFERVVLQERPEEERVHYLAVCTSLAIYFTELLLLHTVLLFLLYMLVPTS
uniref:Uncharacterized protein n=1 Tax=Aegilops tauschii subsp. strangulata TaxID=200361 RepID=A0A453B5Y4_AEGTS